MQLGSVKRLTHIHSLLLLELTHPNHVTYRLAAGTDCSGSVGVVVGGVW